MPSDAPRTSRPSPFIYLSAGVSNAEFTETLELAGEAGTRFSGVLCGRATWKDGIAVYGKQGAAAFKAWLDDQGVKNISNVNATSSRRDRGSSSTARSRRRSFASQRPAASFQRFRGREALPRLGRRSLSSNLNLCERRLAVSATAPKLARCAGSWQLSVALQILHATDLPKARIP